MTRYSINNDNNLLDQSFSSSFVIPTVPLKQQKPDPFRSLNASTLEFPTK